MKSIGGKIDKRKQSMFTFMNIVFFFLLMRTLGIRNDIAVNVVFIAMSVVYYLTSIYYTTNPMEVLITLAGVNILGVFISFNTIRIEEAVILFGIMGIYGIVSYLIYNRMRTGRNVLIIGTHPRKEEFIELITENKKYNRIVESSKKDLSRSGELKRIIEENRIVDICLLEEEMEDNLLDALLKKKARGIRIYDYREFYELIEGKVALGLLKDEQLLTGRGYDIYSNQNQKRMKRNLDLLCATLTIILTFPLHIAAFIRGVEKKMVVGENGREFYQIRYRSSNPSWERRGMLWNVIRGEMSLIGPGADELHEREHYKDRIRGYSMRATVKPGIIGWQQINYLYRDSEVDRKIGFMYDLYYIKHQCMALDITILVRYMLGKIGINY